MREVGELDGLGADVLVDLDLVVAGQGQQSAVTELKCKNSIREARETLKCNF